MRRIPSIFLCLVMIATVFIVMMPIGTSAPLMVFSKVADVTEADPGDTIVYTLDYENTVSEDAYDVTITDTIPDDTAFVSSSPIPDSIFGNTYTWNIGYVPGNTGGSITITVTVDTYVPDMTILYNAATLEYKDINGVAAPPLDVYAAVTVTAPIMTLSKEANVLTASPGDPIVYTVDYINSGSGHATDVIITDTIPGDTTFVSSTPLFDSEVGDEYTWNIGVVGGGATGSITITVTVDSGVAAGTTLHNSAILDYDDANGNPYPYYSAFADVISTLPVDAQGPYGTPTSPICVGVPVAFQAVIIGGNVNDYMFRWDVDNDGFYETGWGPYGLTDYVHTFMNPFVGQARVDAWDGTWFMGNPVIVTDTADVYVYCPVHNLNTNEYFDDIQTAISDTDTLNGHEIEVDPGIYNENVVVSKAIILTGSGKTDTIIQGDGTQDVVQITADGVVMTGFTVTNSGTGTDDSGIELNGRINCQINDNEISNNHRGICLISSDNNEVTNNNITNNDIGIALDTTSNNEFYYNNIIGNTNQLTSVSSSDIWDDGAGSASKGNFWSDYAGMDDGSGGRNWGDGIGDSEIPHPFTDQGNGYHQLDNYPLMWPTFGDRVHNLDTDEYFDKIQAAIDDPETLSTHHIEVEAGTYNENVDVNKQITLTGTLASITAVDGGGGGDVVQITADGVVMTGFTVTNSGTGTDDSGVELDGRINCQLDNNIISTNNRGICLLNSNDNKITNNDILNNDIGIVLDTTSNNEFYYNNIIGNTNQLTRTSSSEIWNDGAGSASKGNFWSDYAGMDDGSGGRNWGDGIGDTEIPHPITDQGNGYYQLDNYPLMWPTFGGPVHNLDTDEYFDEIQAAIDDPETLGTHNIKVEAGTYTENVVVNKAIVLTGSGKTITVIDGGGSGDVVTITFPANGATITDFRITNSGGANYGIKLVNVENCVVDNNELSGNPNKDILIDTNSAINTISNNDILSSNTCGIVIEPFSYDNIISGNTVTNHFQGIQLLLGSNNNDIIGNDISSNTDTGIFLQDSDSNTISGNTISNNVNYGIWLISSSSGNDILNNVQISNSNYGIYISMSSTGNTISSNPHINENQIGIYIDSSDSNTISWNTIHDNPQYGVYIYSSTGHVHHNAFEYSNLGVKLDASPAIVEDNTYLECGPGMESDPSFPIIRRNIFINCTIGIKMDHSYGFINDNIFIGCTYGIYCYYSDPIITNNIITESEYGIYLDHSSPTIENNTLEYNVYGIFVGPDSDPIIDNNTYVNNTYDNYFMIWPIDIDPDTLNLDSEGKWITCYIEATEGIDLNDVDTLTIIISEVAGVPVVIPAENHPINIGDYDNDGIPDLMVKFDRTDVQDAAWPGDIEIIVVGELTDGTPFEGYYTIRVINPGK